MASGDRIVLAAQGAGYHSLQGVLGKGAGNTLNVPEMALNIGGNGPYGFAVAEATDLDPLTNNDGTIAALSLGDNVYLYAVRNSSGYADLVFSANSTYPSGYDATNSRKIGGFHYGRVRAVNSDGVPVDAGNAVYGAGWESNIAAGILPNSVWDLANRPKCDPAGMAKINDTTWADIYLVSAAVAVSLSSGKLNAGLGQSAYNATPLTGTEGLNAYNFNELAKRQGKRMLSLNEWLQAAEGSPQGADGNNTNAWAATSNVGRATCGAVANAVSARNIVDCVGNVWEWLDEYIIRQDGTAGWAWHNPMSGQGVGQLYMYTPSALVAVLAGGYWYSGVFAGSRAATLHNYPWNVFPYIGSRFACDAL